MLAEAKMVVVALEGTMEEAEKLVAAYLVAADR